MTELHILRDCKGSEDGFSVRQFYKGEVYEVSRSLARDLISSGWAKITDEQLKKNWQEMFEDTTFYKCLIPGKIESIRKFLHNDENLLVEFNKMVEEYGYAGS